MLVENWSKNSEARDLNGLLLLLHNIDETFGDSTPYKIEEAHCLSLSRLCVLPTRRISFVSLVRVLLVGITNKLQIEVGEGPVEGARIINTLLNECEF